MIHDTIAVTGKIVAVLTDKNGAEKYKFSKDNLVVQVGKNFLATAITNNSTSPFGYMALGGGTAAPSTSDTALQSEITRQALQSSSTIGSSTTMIGYFGPGIGTGTLTEAGIFNAASSGTMLSRIVFGAVSKTPTDSLTITWTVSLS